MQHSFIEGVQRDLRAAHTDNINVLSLASDSGRKIYTHGFFLRLLYACAIYQILCVSKLSKQHLLYNPQASEKNILNSSGTGGSKHRGQTLEVLNFFSLIPEKNISSEGKGGVQLIIKMRTEGTRFKADVLRLY